MFCFSITSFPVNNYFRVLFCLGYVYFYPYAITSLYTFCSRQEQTRGCLLNRCSVKTFQKTFPRSVEIHFQTLMVFSSNNVLVSFCSYLILMSEKMHLIQKGDSNSKRFSFTEFYFNVSNKISSTPHPLLNLMF